MPLSDEAERIVKLVIDYIGKHAERQSGFYSGEPDTWKIDAHGLYELFVRELNIPKETMSKWVDEVVI